MKISQQFVSREDVHRINEKERAARAMLAALKEAEELVGICRVGKNSYEQTQSARKAVAKAIAAAEAAGITEEK